MSYILPKEINVNDLRIDLKDKLMLTKALWKSGNIKPITNESFIKRFVSIKDPVKIARRAKAYVALKGKPYVNETTFSGEFAIMVNRLFEVGFNAQQIHDIAQTAANAPVLIFPEA